MGTKEVLFEDTGSLKQLGLEERLARSDLPRDVIVAIAANGDLTKRLADQYLDAMDERDMYKRQLEDLKSTYSQKEQAYQIQIEELESKLLTDGLTDVNNRKSFDKDLQVEVSESSRHNTNLSLAMLDIDYFKRVNDIYGHQAGDYVLKTFAKKIKEVKRREDVIYRYGGEEFALIIPHAEVEQAELFAERIRDAIENTTFEYHGQKIPVTVSIGLAQYKQGENEEQLLSKSDQALYQAKETGRNKVVTSKE